MARKILKRAGLGFILGAIVGALIVIFMGLFSDGSIKLPGTALAIGGSEAGGLLVQMLVSGLFGMIPMAGVTFYDLESWGLLKQAVVHYLSYMTAFILIGLFMGWVEPTVTDIGFMAGIFAVYHAIIWLIMYARYKAEVKELDVLLEEAKENS